MDTYTSRVSRLAITYTGLTFYAALQAATPPVRVTVTPSFTVLHVGATIQLKPAVVNTANTQVRWL